MIIDHVGLSVSNFEISKQFYLKTLAPLKIGLIMEFDKAAAFGRDGKPEFWFGSRKLSKAGAFSVRRRKSAAGQRILRSRHCCRRKGQRAPRHKANASAELLRGFCDRPGCKQY
jgi:hypothetical protein